jgi:Dolichyl-phosphate-mannose-protein mannosyltransferase
VRGLRMSLCFDAGAGYAVTEGMRRGQRPELRVTALVLIALAVAALAVAARWSHISAAPMDFASARQYHALTLARWYYIRDSNAPEWQKRVAEANFDQEPKLELPVMEYVAASAYRVVGGERIWIPRLLSSLFWVAGGVFVYFLARRFAHAWAAVLAVLVYLFFPFPLVASTSFQPDPLMIFLLVAALFAIVRHHEQPTRSRLLLAGGLAGAAIFVKPGIAAFFLLPVFVALVLTRQRWKAALQSADSYLFLSLAIFPTAAFYAYSFAAHRFLSQQPGVEINPHLLVKSFYWRGWLDMVEAVLRPPLLGDRAAIIVLLVAIGGVLMSRTPTQRRILAALWLGYVCFGLVISNQTSSHDYYSLPLIPIVALSLALVADVVFERVRSSLRGHAAVRPALAALAVLLGGVAAFGVNARAGAVGIPEPSRAWEDRVQVFQQIGQLVNHSPNALALDPWGLWYHGWVAGRYWPDQDDLLWERRNDGLRPMSAKERFVTTDGRYWPAVGTMHPPPSFFIVAEPFQLVYQPDLCVLLSKYQMLAATPDYVVFDLRNSAAAGLSGSRVLNQPESADYFYDFPPSWKSLVPGVTSRKVLRLVGRPSRTAQWTNLGKPVEEWFYGQGDKYAIVFVDGRLFVKAQRYR